jgi:uncharacterized membrane protein
LVSMAAIEGATDQNVAVDRRDEAAAVNAVASGSRHKTTSAISHRISTHLDGAESAGVFTKLYFADISRKFRFGTLRGNTEYAMTLAPLLDAPTAIQAHAFAAMAAFALGVVQLAAPKGTLPHRMVGWSWVALMAVVAVSSAFIHGMRLWGPFSPIHLLSIFTLIVLPVAVWRAHQHDVRNHRNAMMGLFGGALVIAGLLTFLPGRIMHAVAFGP